MRRVLPPQRFSTWFRGFLPRLAEEPAAGLLQPAIVADRADPKIVHLAGLNLSRAWCWRQLAPSLPREVAALARNAADAHVGHSLSAATSGDYVGTHWLASFALLALTGDRPIG